MNKYCVYTCLIGDYDALIIPKVIDNNFDYICYTDRPQLLSTNKIGPWEIRHLLFFELDVVRNQRWHKIVGYQYLSEYYASIYIDNTINIISDYIYNLVLNTRKQLIIPKHFNRNCIFDELNECKISNKDSSIVLSDVYTLLSKSGMPKKYGLTENNLIYRVHHVQKIDGIMNEWWVLLTKYSKRDQLSLCYVLWQHYILPDEIEIPNIRYDSENFRVYPHISAFNPISFLRAIYFDYYSPYQPAHTFYKICGTLLKRLIHFMIHNLRSIY